GRDRAVDDGDRARGAAEQDRLRQRPVQRHLVTLDRAHVTSAPPPKEKKDRKKLDAAKAIEMPNTICTSRRKPPEASPKERVRPVVMMIITAMILATGPWSESRICCNGASHGMPVPDASAAPGTKAKAATPASRRM